MFLDINKRILLEDVGLQISNDNLLKKYISKNTAVAMYDFASQEDNQLGLFCGQKIVVWTEDKGILISNSERWYFKLLKCSPQFVIQNKLTFQIPLVMSGGWEHPKTVKRDIFLPAMSNL